MASDAWPPRSFLYVPGDRHEKLNGALDRGADALILDLEDAVLAPNKEKARAAVAEWISNTANPRSTPVWVRVNNAPGLIEEDLSAVAQDGVTGVFLPKVNGPEFISQTSDRLDQLERSAGLAAGSLSVVAMIESAEGVLNAAQIARSDRVARLALGEADLAAELGFRPSEDGTEWHSIRTQVILASAAAGIDPPIGPTSLDFRNLEQVRRTTRALQRLGFEARTAIHPSQVAVINEVLTPSAEEIADAQTLIDRFDQTQKAGRGVTTHEGTMIDVAVIRSARRTLARAAGLGHRDPTEVTGAPS